ncbi:phage holin, lambda family [Gilliamella sp. wkB72]|nr:phage holin, lambda family [Gilliamella apicola]OCL21320.1 phage holin, lambda family [Gilliamella apicola]
MMRKKMYKNTILDWLQANWPMIYASLMAFIIAFGRLTYDGVGGRRKWVEAIFCGAVTMSASTGLEFFGFSVTLAPFVGGVIGWLGIDKLRQLSHAIVDKKVGIKNEDEDKKN